jgi:hypothetical protein
VRASTQAKQSELLAADPRAQVFAAELVAPHARRLLQQPVARRVPVGVVVCLEVVEVEDGGREGLLAA